MYLTEADCWECQTVQICINSCEQMSRTDYYWNHNYLSPDCLSGPEAVHWWG